MQPTDIGPLHWLAPTLAALFAWGIAQGLVKKYIGEVSAAHFCLYYALADAIINVGFWSLSDAADRAPSGCAHSGGWRPWRSAACWS